MLDGVFVPNDDGALEFHALPSLSNTTVAELLQTIRARVLAYLEKRGVIESRREPVLIDDGSADREPALAAAAVAGLVPAGPERRKRPPIALRDESALRIASGLSVAEAGFSLHAATTASADDARARVLRTRLLPATLQSQRWLTCTPEAAGRLDPNLSHLRADRAGCVVDASGGRARRGRTESGCC